MRWRRRSLATRLTWSHLLATAAALTLLGAALVGLLVRNQRAQVLASLEAQASIYAAYAAELAPNTNILEGVADRVVRRFPPPPGVVARIFAPNGALLTSDQRIGAFPSRPAQTFVAGQIPFLPLPPQNRRYVARPIEAGTQRIGIVEVSRDLASEHEFMRATLFALALAALLALAGAVLLAQFLARNLARPLVELGGVADRIATGDLAARAPETRADEIGMLARRVNQMAAELENRIQQVEQLAEARREFYRAVSHELRTPLTALRGIAENLEDSVPADQQASVAIMQAETERLQRLVEELLAGGERSFEPRREQQAIDLRQLVLDVVELMQPRAERAGIRLEYEGEAATMMGDRDRLRQALVNLLDNALRWTPAGGQVRVRLRMEGNEHDGQIRVLIEDTGPGIPAELRPRLWERGTTGDRNGHGLGLALVREIVEAHGGTARLVPGAGTTVELAFPRATEDAQHGDTETRRIKKGERSSR